MKTPFFALSFNLLWQVCLKVMQPKVLKFDSFEGKPLESSLDVLQPIAADGDLFVGNKLWMLLLPAT